MFHIDIKFASDPNGKVHEFSCNVPRKVKDKLQIAYSKESNGQNMLVVDEYVEQFNNKVGGLISDYEYDVFDDKNVNIGVLMKHVFKGMKESRKYFKCKIRTDTNKVMVKISDKIQSKLCIPEHTERLPVSTILAEYIEDETDHNIIKLSIRFETTKDMTGSRSFEAAITLITEGMYEAFDEAHNMPEE